MQSTPDILMIRPVKFGFNEQTADSNAFQSREVRNEQLQDRALAEFDHFVRVLRDAGVRVTVIEDTPQPYTPDSIFPNNWLTTHADGMIYLYPMEAENRRLERRMDIVEILRRDYLVRDVKDLSSFEKEGKYLEGTGSMVLDRVNKIIYACLSSRTNEEVLSAFAASSGFRIVPFHAFDEWGKAIYHTNVMMAIGSSCAIVCLESIHDLKERALLTDTLTATSKEIVAISKRQMASFAGNMLELRNAEGEKLLVLSSQAYHSLNGDQLRVLGSHFRSIHAPLDTIETAGGGSARCMIAEIYLPHRTSL